MEENLKSFISRIKNYIMEQTKRNPCGNLTGKDCG